MKGQMRLWNLVVASVLLFSVLFGGSAPQSVQATGVALALSSTTPVTQNFDGIGPTATAGLPNGWGVTKDGLNVRTVGLFSAATFLTERAGGNSMGTSASNGIYNFGAGDAAAATDRAVGFLSSSSATKSGNLYAHFTNSTETDLIAVSLSYNVEKYRNGSNPNGFTVQLYYSLNGTAWTAAPAQFQTNFVPDADNAGYASAPGTTIAVSNQDLAVSVPVGSDLYLAWNYSSTATTTTSNAQALAIDDFSILGICPTCSTNPKATGAATPNKLISGETTTLLTMAVTPGTNPPSVSFGVSCDLTTIGGSPTQTFYDDGAQGGDVTAADNLFSYSTRASAATTSGAKSLPCTISDDQNRTRIATIGLTTYLVLPIGTVNGPIGDATVASTHNAAYLGQTVAITGVIYEKTLQPIKASANAYYGFFIQNTTPQADGDTSTSDGLFVYMSTIATMSAPGATTYTPTVGDEVTISGLVIEYFNMTELTSPSLIMPVSRTNVELATEIPPFIANPPVSLADANRYWERRQGMRAQVPLNSLVISGRSVFSPPDGEIWLVSPDSTVAQRAAPYQNRAFRDAHPLDDNYDATTWDGNGYRILMGSWGLKATVNDVNALIDPARTFSTVTNTPAGGINYSFSKYRIEVTSQPTFDLGPDPAANQPPQVVDPSLGYTIADYNLENLYDFRDNPFSGCDFTTDSGCPMVVPFTSAVTPPYDYVPVSDAVYQERLTDIANQIITDLHSPDILMVQEVENQDICTVTAGALACGTTDNADGKPDVLQELALKITALGGPTYDAAFDRDSSDLRGILPAYMYRTNRVQLANPVGDPILGGDPVLDYPGASVANNAQVSNPKTLNAVLPAGVTACDTAWVFPRAPVVALFQVNQTSIGVGSSQTQNVYIINNHFKSGPDSCVPYRTEEAKYNAAIVKAIETADANARVVLGGDLNVYPRPDDPVAPIGQPGSTDQLGSLYAPGLGLTNLWDVLVKQAPETAYSYVYLGMAQTLDQVFVSQAMMANLHQFRIAHINSDFPSDYTGDGARGTSDHDPMVATFYWETPAPTANAGGPYRVNQGAGIQLSATATDPTGGPATYAWDLNNDGIFETAGQTVTYTAGFVPGNQPIAVQVTGSTGLKNVALVNVFVNYRYILVLIYH